MTLLLTRCHTNGDVASSTCKFSSLPQISPPTPAKFTLIYSSTQTLKLSVPALKQSTLSLFLVATNSVDCTLSPGLLPTPLAGLPSLPLKSIPFTSHSAPRVGVLLQWSSWTVCFLRGSPLGWGRSGSGERVRGQSKVHPGGVCMIHAEQ